MKLHPSLVDQSIESVLKNAGIAGCGGAGFPTWPKYAEGEVPLKALVVNAQESEPGYAIDKWHHKNFAAEYAELFAWLLDNTSLEKIIIGAKERDRAWFGETESLLKATVLDCTGRNRHDPFAEKNPYLVMYTDDRYAFGKEGALLLITAQAKIPKGELPRQHGFVVNNSQTLFYMHQALTKAEKVTHSYVHVFGETPAHIMKRAPVGTTLNDLLEAAGSSLADMEAKGFVALEGGPGWYEVIANPHSYSTTRRTNSVLLVDPSYRDPSGKDVVNKANAPGYPKENGPVAETAPSADIEVKHVRLWLKDNPAFEFVNPAKPIRSEGEAVRVGDVIAEAGEGFSLPVHASIEGRVSKITDQYIEVKG